MKASGGTISGTDKASSNMRTGTNTMENFTTDWRTGKDLASGFRAISTKATGSKA